jgi:hypothetical protein
MPRPGNVKKRSRHVLLLLLVVFAGCSGRPGRVRPPKVDADAAATKAIEQLDKDANGQLSEAELQAAPGLLSAKERYDADHSGALSQEEIAAGIRRWSEGKFGAAAVAYTVQLDGRPLPGAQVKAIPEAFLGDAIKPATGVEGYLAVAPEDRPPNAPKLPLILPGLYRIEITHPTAKIPAKYNSQTTLGLEVSADLSFDQAILWQLKSR